MPATRSSGDRPRAALPRLLLAGLLGGFACAGAAEEPAQRAAFAISGGASLGAYEAGLNWAAIAVMRAAREGSWSALGGLPRPYDVVAVAGTSAGGINTLLTGLAWCARPEGDGGYPNRIDDNVFRIWLEPDVNDLLPPQADAAQYLPDDAALARRPLIDIAADLRQRWRTPGAFLDGCRVPMGVTVTRVEPERLRIGDVDVENQRQYIPFEMRVQADGSAAFFFDPKHYPRLVDPAMILLPRAAGTPPHSIEDQRIEDAVLATSAFPTAFGRKRLRYCRSAGLSADERTAATPAREAALAASDLVCPEGYELAEAEFADGGLFDNLPIGLARLLAEFDSRTANPLPVTYFYLDPNRERYETPAPVDPHACLGTDPPPACREMAFSLFEEADVLGGALGTARRYELYRELSGEAWRLNLFAQSHALAQRLEAMEAGMRCGAELPWFDRPLDCATSLRNAGALLELAYDYQRLVIAAPFSPERLQRAGIAEDCRLETGNPATAGARACRLDEPRLRRALADALAAIVARAGLDDTEASREIERAGRSMLNDRIIRVTSRGAPVTGSLLGAFAAFLEYKFRAYDYNVGVYDALIVATETQCGLRHVPSRQDGDYRDCVDRFAKPIYEILGVDTDPRARYVFALLARDELGEDGLLRFAYDPMPPPDEDMRIIHEALAKTLQSGRRDRTAASGAVSIERGFFDHLRAEGFEPTPVGDGEPLMARIMDDTEFWSQELVRRWTNRLVHLELEAERIYADREPDPAKREAAYPALLGASALALQTGTYKYPRFAFAPSTAPAEWRWRNLIPYEVALDLREGDVLLLWQPTWAVQRTNVGIRFGLGFAGGFLESTADATRENYGTAGVDITVLTGSVGFSGWGVAPAVYHNWDEPPAAEQTTFGIDVHGGFLKNRLRVGLGVRDVDESRDTWFLTLGFADVPALIYWLTR